MKKTVIKDAGGAVINIGTWDYKLIPVMGDDPDKPIHDDAGEIVGYAQTQVDEFASNPLPAGAYEEEADVVEGVDGGLFMADDHTRLRQAAYPSIGDQLDALFKAGLFPSEMAAQLAAVKAKYPKAEDAS
jgi:hypothetical protein